MSQPPDKRPPFSMIRSFAFADVITLGNGVCGAGSILALMQHIASGDVAWLWCAIVLSPLALFLDFADGRVARWRHRSSPIGADLDSLADVISFGVAPAVLGFTLGLRGGWDMVVLTYFVVCGVSRLARFNVTSSVLTDDTTGKVTHFEGTPIPTSIVIVGLLAAALWFGRIDADVWFGSYRIGPAVLHPLVLLYGLSGSAMISATLRVPKP